MNLTPSEVLQLIGIFIAIGVFELLLWVLACHILPGQRRK